MNILAKKVAVASDHAGFELKTKIVAKLKELGLEVIDLGTNGSDSVDYPDYGHKMAEAIKSDKAEMGVLVCGTGIGISIAANRHNGVRAAVCHSVETAKLAREHNNANVLALGARIIDENTALNCVETFLTTKFAGGRHAGRVSKLG